MDKARIYAVALALGLAAISGIYVSGAAFLVKSHALSPAFGIETVILKGGLLLVYATLAACAVAVGLAFLVQPRGGRAAALICLAVILAIWAPLSGLAWRAKHLPPIHDISTNTQDRPVFSQKIVESRGPTANALTAPNGAGLQHQFYPNIKSMTFNVQPAFAYDAALRTLQSQDFTIINADPAHNIIEASARTKWFGLESDVIVRVRQADQGCVVDIRSASRVGIRDYGNNVSRIKNIQAGIQGEIAKL